MIKFSFPQTTTKDSRPFFSLSKRGFHPRDKGDGGPPTLVFGCSFFCLSFESGGSDFRRTYVILECQVVLTNNGHKAIF